MGIAFLMRLDITSAVARDVEKRRASNRRAAEKRRRARGVVPRSKLSAEEERLRGIRYSIEYRNRNREKVNSWRRSYLAEKRKDPLWRMQAAVRSRISNAMKRGCNKPMTTVEGLGCTYAQLKLHLEKQFQDGMTWDNYGRNGWHVDHVKPLAWFDLSDPRQFAAAMHYTNLQPLWGRLNESKGARRSG